MAEHTRAAIYLRISKDYERTGDAIERQKEDALEAIRINKWSYVETYIDDSISAYSGRIRPKYECMLTDFKKGDFDIVVCYRLDRLTRNAITFARAIEELQTTQLKILTTDDMRTYDLSTPVGLADAMKSAAEAQAESAIKSARQVRANEQRAKRGEGPKNRRLFGYTRAGVPIEAEAEIVRQMFKLFLSGTSINAIMRSLSGIEHIDGLPETPNPRWTRNTEANEVRAREGKRLLKVPEKRTWNRSTVRETLANPAYAGYIARTPWREQRKNPLRDHTIPVKPHHTYIVKDNNGEPIKAKRPAIVDKDVYWAVQSKLDDPRRKTNHVGNERRFLGSGLYLCGVCHKPMSCSSGSYRCDGHVNRRVENIDALVIETVKARLARSDVAKLLPKTESPRLAELATEMREVTGRIAQVQNDYDDGLIRAADLTRARDRLEAKLAGLQSERARLATDSAIGSLVGYEDPVAEFERMDLGRKREVVGALMTVTLHKHRKGDHNFTGDDVEITWKV